MKCFFCKSDMENSFTTYVAELEGCIVIIKNVPCIKCTQCGEVSYSGDVVLKIEEILEKCESVMTEVAIVNYKDMAA